MLFLSELPDAILVQIGLSLRPDLASGHHIGHMPAPTGDIVNYGCLSRAFEVPARVAMLYQVELSSGPRISALLRFLHSAPRWAGHIRRLTVRNAYTLPWAAQVDEVVRLAANARAFALRAVGSGVDVTLARAMLSMRRLSEVEVAFAAMGPMVPPDSHRPVLQVILAGLAQNASMMRSIALAGIEWHGPLPPSLSLPALRVLRLSIAPGGEALACWLANAAPALDELELRPAELFARIDRRVTASVTTTSTSTFHPALHALTALRRLRIDFDSGPATAGDFRNIPPSVQSLAINNYSGDSLQVGITMLGDESWLPELCTLSWRYREPLDAYEATIRARQTRQLVEAADAWGIDCQTSIEKRRTAAEWRLAREREGG